MLPIHPVVSTLRLLQRAFPLGIPESEYLALLTALYPHMADENLAIVIAEFTGRHVGVVLNDVLAAGARAGSTDDVVDQVCDRLRREGFDEWVGEDVGWGSRS